MSQEVAPATPGSTLAFWSAVLAICFVLTSSVAYSFHEHRIAEQLSALNGEVMASLNSTRSQVDALTAQLNDISAAAATSQKPAPLQASEHHSSAYQGPSTRIAIHRRAADDPRWKKFQGQLDEQGQQIESTRLDLASARTELQGSIARTHDELVVLEKKGERSYFEFDLDKANQFEQHGPMGIRLRKANTKHEYADLELMVDDLKLAKKHVNVYEPVMFYVGDSQQPVELVINSIGRDQIHGYVSQPRYGQSELQAQVANASGLGNIGGGKNETQSSAKSNGEPQLKQRQ